MKDFEDEMLEIKKKELVAATRIAEGLFKVHEELEKISEAIQDLRK